MIDVFRDFPGRSARRVLVACALAFALLISACSPGNSSTTGATTTIVPPARTVLRIGVEAWPDCLNPLLCDSAVLRDQILQHVLPVAYEVTADNEYAPSAVLNGDAEVSLEGEGMTVTYRINPAARWSDGKPITSSDFLGTWRAVMTTPGADTTGYELITAVDDADPLVAVVTLSRRYGEWRELFGGSKSFLLQADSFGATTDLTGSFREELPMSAGPFQVLRWSPTEAVLARVTDYWDTGRAAGVDQVRYRDVELAEADPAAFDILWPQPASTMTPPPGFGLRLVPSTRVLGIWFDRRTELLQADEHRAAIASSLDREALIEAATASGLVAGTVDCLGWVPGAGPWCEAAAVARFPLNRQAANAALSQAQWTRNAAGQLVREEQPFAVTVTYDANDQIAAAVAPEVREALGALGIQAGEGKIPTARWRGRRDASAMTDVGVYTFDLGFTPDSEGLYRCPGGGETSVMAWCLPETVADVRALRSTVEVEKRLDLVAAIGERAQSSRSWIPLAQLADRVMIREGRVDAPTSAKVVGGPLDNLWGFRVAE